MFGMARYLANFYKRMVGNNSTQPTVITHSTSTRTKPKRGLEIINDDESDVEEIDVQPTRREKPAVVLVEEDEEHCSDDDDVQLVKGIVSRETCIN
jgi:hypothetical protein